MKVIELLTECRNGIKIEIEQHIYRANGDTSSTVFKGVIGKFGKTGYEREDVAYISIRDNTLLIYISKVE